MNCASSKKKKDTIKVELKSMEQNNVWDLVLFLEGSNRVGYKWVFKTKCDPKGNIERNKAPLIVKGFTQKDDIDYEERFIQNHHDIGSSF